MTDFTPGPWNFYGSRHVWDSTKNDQRLIAIANDDVFGTANAEANARLIAQAPALYEALEAAVSVQVFNNWVTAGETVCCVCGELPESLRHDDDCWAGKALAVLAAARNE